MQFLKTKDPAGGGMYVPAGYIVAFGAGRVYTAARTSDAPQGDFMAQLMGGGKVTFTKLPTMTPPSEAFLSLPADIRKQFIVVTLSPEQCDAIATPPEEAPPEAFTHHKLAKDPFFAVRADALGSITGFGGDPCGTKGMIHLLDEDRYGTVEPPEQIKALAESVG